MAICPQDPFGTAELLRPIRLSAIACFLAVCQYSSSEILSPIHIGDLKSIWKGESDSVPLEQARDLLQTGLKQMFGISPESSKKRPDSLNGIFILGKKAALATATVTKSDFEKVTPGGYIVRCGGSRVAISGPDDWSTYYGVVEFLERQGARFYNLAFQAKSYWPKLESNSLMAFTLFRQPGVLLPSCHKFPNERPGFPTRGTPNRPQSGTVRQ